MEDGDSWRGSRGPPRDDRGPPPRSGGGDGYPDDQGPPRRPDDREGGGRWRNREDDRDPGPWRRDGPPGGRSEGTFIYLEMVARNCSFWEVISKLDVCMKVFLAKKF